LARASSAASLTIAFGVHVARAGWIRLWVPVDAYYSAFIFLWLAQGAYWIAILAPIAVSIAIRLRLERAERGGARDGVCSAFDVLAVGLLPTSSFGHQLASTIDAAKIHGPDFEPGSVTAVMAVVVRTLAFWLTTSGVVLAIVASSRRRTLRDMGLRDSAATVLVLVIAPALLPLVAVSLAAEEGRGGAAMLVLYPMLAAAVATTLSWLLARRIHLARPLRKYVALAVPLAVLISSVASGAVAADKTALTSTWRLLAFDKLGLPFLVVATAMFFARDADRSGVGDARPSEGPYR
jgi:hypothetical protein